MKKILEQAMVLSVVAYVLKSSFEEFELLLDLRL